MRVIIVGGGRVGRGLVERLEDRGENVIIIASNQLQAENARNEGFTVHHGDGADTDVLRSAGAENAQIVAATTTSTCWSYSSRNRGSTSRHHRSGEHPRERRGVRGTRRPGDLGQDSIAHAMDNAIERPALAESMTEPAGRRCPGVEVTADDLVEKFIWDLDSELPGGVLVALASRDGASQLPEPEVTLQRGDHLTFVGRRDAIHDAIEQCHPELRS